MRRPLLLLAVVIGLVAASLVAIAVRPAVLGLDLQGGVEVVLQGQPTDTSEVTPEAISRSVEIIRSRVDAFGVAEPEIQTQGSDQIVVALPGADNPQQVVNDLIAPAQLMFINFERNVVNPEGETDLYKAVQLATRTTPDNTHGKPTYYAFKDKKLVGDVRAKTGYINNSMCLSGYVTNDQTGRRVAFSILVNGAKGAPLNTRDAKKFHEDVVAAVDKWLARQAPRAKKPVEQEGQPAMGG